MDNVVLRAVAGQSSISLFTDFSCVSLSAGSSSPGIAKRTGTWAKNGDFDYTVQELGLRLHVDEVNREVQVESYGRTVNYFLQHLAQESVASLVLTLQTTKSEDGDITASFINLGGNEVAKFDAVGPNSIDHLRDQLAAALDHPKRGIVIMLPDSTSLKGSDFEMRVIDCFMAPRTKHAKYLRALLASETAVQAQCKTAFQKFDDNKNGVIEACEASRLLASLCAKFGIPLPDEGKVKGIFDLADRRHDAVLHADEFPTFFKAVLDDISKEVEADLRDSK